MGSQARNNQRLQSGSGQINFAEAFWLIGRRSTFLKKNRGPVVKEGDNRDCIGN